MKPFYTVMHGITTGPCQSQQLMVSVFKTVMKSHIPPDNCLGISVYSRPVADKTRDFLH